LFVFVDLWQPSETIDEDEKNDEPHQYSYASEDTMWRQIGLTLCNTQQQASTCVIIVIVIIITIIISVKTSQFITQCKGDISQAFKTATITVFDQSVRDREREFISQINKLNKYTTISKLAGCQWRQASINAGRP